MPSIYFICHKVPTSIIPSILALLLLLYETVFFIVHSSLRRIWMGVSVGWFLMNVVFYLKIMDNYSLKRKKLSSQWPIVSEMLLFKHNYNTLPGFWAWESKTWCKHLKEDINVIVARFTKNLKHTGSDETLNSSNYYFRFRPHFDQYCKKKGDDKRVGRVKRSWK